MLVCCLYVFHWSVPPQYTISLALIIAVVLTIRVGWSMAKEKFGHEQSAIPRVESVCNNLRRSRALPYPVEAAAQPTDEFPEYGAPPL
jgi:hypothetical protein